MSLNKKIISKENLNLKIKNLEKNKIPLGLDGNNSDIIEYLILRGIEKKFNIDVFSRLSSMKKDITCQYKTADNMVNWKNIDSALYISISCPSSHKDNTLKNTFNNMDKEISKNLDRVTGNSDGFSHYFDFPQNHIGFKFEMTGSQAIDLLELGIKSLTPTKNNVPTQKELMPLHNHFSQNTIAKNDFKNRLEITDNRLRKNNKIDNFLFIKEKLMPTISRLKGYWFSGKAKRKLLEEALQKIENKINNKDDNTLTSTSSIKEILTTNVLTVTNKQETKQVSLVDVICHSRTWEMDGATSSFGELQTNLKNEDINIHLSPSIS